MRVTVSALMLVLGFAGAALAQRPARMVEARADHAVVALEDGRLLVAGGRAAFEEGRVWALLGSTELDDGRRWRPSAPLSVARAGLRLTRLTDGRVLATGGVDGSEAFAVAELWDPRTERWTGAAPMREPRAHHASVRLADGRVLVAGGSSNGTAYGLASAEVYDPAADRWLALRSVLIWSPRTGRWSRAPDFAQPRASAAAALVPGTSTVLCFHLHAALRPSPKRKSLSTAIDRLFSFSPPRLP